MHCAFLKGETNCFKSHSPLPFKRRKNRILTRGEYISNLLPRPPLLLATPPSNCFQRHISHSNSGYSYTSFGKSKSSFDKGSLTAAAYMFIKQGMDGGHFSYEKEERRKGEENVNGSGVKKRRVTRLRNLTLCLPAFFVISN